MDLLLEQNFELMSCCHGVYKEKTTTETLGWVDERIYAKCISMCNIYVNKYTYTYVWMSIFVELSNYRAELLCGWNLTNAIGYQMLTFNTRTALSRTLWTVNVYNTRTALSRTLWTVNVYIHSIQMTMSGHTWIYHDYVIKGKHFRRNRSPVNSPHKDQWCGALMFSLICTRTNGWVNTREAGDLRRHCTLYDVTAMISKPFGKQNLLCGNILTTSTNYQIITINITQESVIRQLLLLIYMKYILK